MAELAFQTLIFKEEKERVKVVLLNLFYFYLDKKELEKIAPFKIQKDALIFPDISRSQAEKKFDLLLAQGLKSLKNSLTQNPAIYIHQNSGLPLIGHLSFGLLYRNTSLIEIKPVTGCNLNCIYCSVGEGLYSQKADFVIEKDYLVQEFKKLSDFVNKPVEAHIGTHGEPFLYGDILPLINDLHDLSFVHTISLDTNGTLLTKKIIDELASLPKVRLNISLNTLNPETARIMAGCPYSLEKVLKTIKYACQKKVRILLAPLLLPGYNESEIEDLVKFAKENSLPLGIQNFLPYKTGRNPVKPWPWEKFYSFLKKLEEKHRIKLVCSPADFNIHYTPKLEKPFRKGDMISAVIACPDRFKNSRIAVAQNRLISLPGCSLPPGKKVKLRIIRDKHNIFVGKVV